MRELGLHPFTQPAGITSRAWTDPYGNHRGGCLYCGFCTRFGCEVDAKASPLNTHFPVALATNRYEIRTNAKVLRIEVDRRPGDRRHLRRRAGPRALPARRHRRRLGVHAREQPAAAALDQQGAPARDRQRPRPRRAELHLPDLSGAGHRRLGGREAQPVHGQHRNDQDHLRLQRRQLRPLEPRLHRRLTALLRGLRARTGHLGRQDEGRERQVVGPGMEGRDRATGTRPARSSPRAR